MSLYAISDLHLSFYKDKPMHIFGEIWKDHAKKIKENWLRTVNNEDTVLIAGDISWAKNLIEFEPDLNFLKELTGKKIFAYGNHDYWWTSPSRLNELDENMKFVRNNFIKYNSIATICSVRGWLCPNDTYFTDKDEKIYKREVNRLKISLESAVNAGFSEIYLLMHFPPTNDKKQESDFIKLIQEFPVKKVIYGHLHGEDCFDLSYKGKFFDIDFHFVSGDYLDFMPIKII